MATKTELFNALSPEQKSRYQALWSSGDYAGANAVLQQAPGGSAFATTGGAVGGAGGAPAGPYDINLESAWEDYQRSLGEFTGAVPTYQPIHGLAQGLEQVGAYQGYDWDQDPLTYEAQTYTPYEYSFANDYQPESYEQFQYELPGLEGPESVAPLAQDYWAAEAARQGEAIGGQFRGTREQALQALAQTQGRKEQAAALLAGLGVEEEKARRESMRDIGMRRAEQELGIAQTEQGLEFQRQQILAEQEARRQAAQAGEQQFEFTAGEQQRQFGTGLSAQQQQAEAEQAKYGTEFKRGEALTQLGIDQWLKEQQAAEEQAKYQSRYSLAQDIASTRAQESEMNRAAQMDVANAMLQASQARGQAFSSAGTYMTNLTEDERKKQQTQRQQAASGLLAQGGQQPTIAYSMPRTQSAQTTPMAQPRYDVNQPKPQQQQQGQVVTNRNYIKNKTQGGANA